MTSRKQKDPCNKLCDYDKDKDICYGCKRKMLEILSWNKISDSERSKIIELIKQRILYY